MLDCSINKKKAILWFRKDLRIVDNVALYHMLQGNFIIYPIYILDETTMLNGAANKWWLHRSLQSLNASLGGALSYFTGESGMILQHIVNQLDINAVFCNKSFEPKICKKDLEIKEHLHKSNVDFKIYNSFLLKNITAIKKKDGGNFKVFTAFLKSAYFGIDAEPILKPICNEEFSKEMKMSTTEYTDIFEECKEISMTNLPLDKELRKRSTIENTPIRRPYIVDIKNHENILKINISLELEDLKLLPKIQWYTEFAEYWEPGEHGASKKFDSFLLNAINGYKILRNRPDLSNSSFLSPHLRFGEISTNMIWYKIYSDTKYSKDHEHFLSELVWREFSYYLLYHFPDLQSKNWNNKFDSFPWHDDKINLQKWQAGQTGYPIIDAGMRQLWRTGYMHNRVRMISASFLIKHLMIDWRHGERWFFDTLLDADLANNSASWQWVAGSGADAAPYFRIFNPILQSEKFDPNGDYIRKFVPELQEIPNKFIHTPWLAPSDILLRSGVRLGKNYPYPIIDHTLARTRALDAYKNL